MNKELLIQALLKLDKAASEKQIRCHFTVCGGASLILQGIALRSTVDIDIIEPLIPSTLVEDIEIIADELGISKDWVNMGPNSILSDLPADWKNHITPLFEGGNITIYSLGRRDLIFTKFWAMCDRQQDLVDLISLSPSLDEIKIAADATIKCDQNPYWEEWVMENMRKLAKELGYDY